MIGTLIVKDFKQFFRNRLFAVMTVISLIGFITIYFLIPDQVDENVGIAFWIENPATFPAYQILSENDNYGFLESEAAMLTTLEESNDYFVGLAIPEAAAVAAANGDPVTMTAYYAPNIPNEAKQIFEDVMIMLANSADPAIVANLNRINDTRTILGNNIYDAPISMRDRILPMLLVFILSVEILGLATLIVREVENGTARAMITAPLRLHQFFTAKALMGMLLAFTQLTLIVAITGKLATSPLLLLTTLFLGSFTIVGIGFLVAAVAKDNMSVLAWGMLVLLLFGIPGISIMLPGLATRWMELIPSFFLVDSLHRILNFEAGWVDVSRNLMMLTLVGIGTMMIGATVLRRRF